MGDIELLLKLNSELIQYNDKTNAVNLFSMKLLNYILKLIATKWSEICNNDNNKIKYTGFTINIISKINNYIMENMKELQDKIKKNNDVIISNNKMRVSLNVKINKILDTISKNDKNIHTKEYIQKPFDKQNINPDNNSSNDDCMVSFSETKDSSDNEESSSGEMVTFSSGSDDCSAIYDA